MTRVFPTLRAATWLRLGVLTGVVLAFHRPATAADTITWYKDLKEASAVAQRANLPMFIDFWADWCLACRVMDDEVYPDARVVEVFQQKIVGVRLHYDLQPDMARRYEVPALPYLVFTNSYGTPLLTYMGLLEAEDLVRVVEAIPPLAEINRLDRGLQEDKNDFTNLLAMARVLRGSGFLQSSNDFYDRASKHRTARTDAVTRESIWYDMALNWLDLQDGDQAATILERCLKEFPRSGRRAEVLLALGRAHLFDEEIDKARASLNTVISDYPQSSAAVQARTLLAAQD